MAAGVANFQVVALVSMLHENGDGSATRLFRDEPILRHTTRRLDGTVAATAVLCWEEQADSARAAVGNFAEIVPVGPRQDDAAVRLVATAQAWHEGWRGGPLMTCSPDRGWHAAAAEAVADATNADAVLAVDASFGLINATLTAKLIEHAAACEDPEPVFFTPCPPGLSGLLVRRENVATLAATADPRRRHPGQALHYLPDAPRIDPVGLAACRNDDPRLTRSTADLRLDSDEQCKAAETTNESADAVQLAIAGESWPARPDVTIELTTRRHTRPIWLDDTADEDLDLDAIPKDLAGCRVTLGGRGDPLCHADWRVTIARIREAGAASVHVETDLLGDVAGIDAADVVSVHLPATTSQTYAAVIRTNRMAEAVANLARLVAGQRCLVVPTFVKLRANLREMESWYDQWLRLAGAAVVRGPDALNNQPPADVLAAPLHRTDRQPVGRMIQPTGRAA